MLNGAGLTTRAPQEKEVRYVDERRYSRYEQGEWISYKNTIRALLQQCTDDGLTVEQALFCLDRTRKEIEKAAMRDPIPRQYSTSGNGGKRLVYFPHTSGEGVER